LVKLLFQGVENVAIEGGHLLELIEEENHSHPVFRGDPFGVRKSGANEGFFVHFSLAEAQINLAPLANGPADFLEGPHGPQHPRAKYQPELLPKSRELPLLRKLLEEGLNEAAEEIPGRGHVPAIHVGQKEVRGIRKRAPQIPKERGLTESPGSKKEDILGEVPQALAQYPKIVLPPDKIRRLHDPAHPKRRLPLRHFWLSPILATFSAPIPTTGEPEKGEGRRG
jgi:hypothetical protein